MNKLRNSIRLAGLSTLCLLATACDDDKIYTTDFTMVHPIDQIDFNCKEGDEYPMMPGMSYQIEYTVGPEIVDDPTIVFTSSDESVATVTQTGLVTAVGVGDATITATPPIGFGATTTLVIHVKNTLVLAESVVVECADQVQDFYYETDQVQLKATILPADHDYNYLSWQSSDESLATVDENGKVSLLKAGKVTISANATDGSNAKGTYDFEIYQMQDVDYITIAPLAEGLCLDGGNYDLDVTYYPVGSTAGSVEWSSSNEEVATVERGRVRPTGFGTTTITGTAPSGKMASVEVTVVSGWRVWDASNSWKLWKAGSNATFTRKDNYIEVKMSEMSSGGNWRGDIQLECSADNPAWFDFSAYPVVAVRATIPQNGRNTLDAVSIGGTNCGGPQCNIGRYASGTPIELSDGSVLFHFNVASKYTNETPTGFSLFQMKAADIPAEDVPASKTYKLYWIRTFKSVDEMKAFAEAELAGN